MNVPQNSAAYLNMEWLKVIMRPYSGCYGFDKNDAVQDDTHTFKIKWTKTNLRLPLLKEQTSKPSNLQICF